MEEKGNNLHSWREGRKQSAELEAEVRFRALSGGIGKPRNPDGEEARFTEQSQEERASWKECSGLWPHNKLR